MGDWLTERERRRHLYSAKVFQRLAARERRRAILHELGKALDGYRALLERRDERNGTVC